jgi:tetratricopeptide (TPR) repeat protein
MKIKVLVALALLISSLPLFAQDTGTNVAAVNPSDQLQQLTAQLQNSPDDAALRGRIIALALTLNPKPATPDAVTMAEGAAEYAFKNAQTNSDFSDAAKQYEKALLLAPWLAADYFNCGVAHEKAGENKEAIRSFKFYLLAAPDADDATAVKKRIGGLQYAEEKIVSDYAAKAEEVAKEQAEPRIGKSYGGGIIFYIDGTGQHGLIAATTDQGQGSWYDAVQLCKDYRGGGYSDWFLPSKDQLNILYLQRNVVNMTGDTGYWSSTEGEGGAATSGVSVQEFYYGHQADNKFAGYKYFNARAIRTF